MQIREIKDKFQWENFICSLPVGGPNTFLHSWNWGEFNKATGDSSAALGAGKIWRLGIFDSERLARVALIIKINAKRGKFLFCPHLLADSKWLMANGKMLFDHLRNLAIKENADFVRISPLMENTPDNLKIFQDYGFRNAPIHMMHPEIAWLLDISKSEDEILKGMRKTTRNLIRRAERPFDLVQCDSAQGARGAENVEISESKNISEVEEFYKLHAQTVGRHGFIPFSKDYLKKEFEAFSPDNQISIFFARHGGQILSSAIVVFYGSSAFYHHGASLASKIPASHLLMWEIIKAAKKRGCKIFNFWGIAPEGKPKHPWAGLSLFKTGFGGYKENYLHAQDLPIKINYWISYAVETIRKIKRGY